MPYSLEYRRKAEERNRQIAEFCRTHTGRDAAKQFGVSLRTVRYAVAQAKRASLEHKVEE